jgi:hypothetical protein
LYALGKYRANRIQHHIKVGAYLQRSVENEGSYRKASLRNAPGAAQTLSQSDADQHDPTKRRPQLHASVPSSCR